MTRRAASFTPDGAPIPDLGKIAYEANIAAHREVNGIAMRRCLLWRELPAEAQAYWNYIGNAVAGAVRAEIVEIGAKIMQAVEPGS
jgi:hypothetical protein